jgi:hypothetical protein
MLGFTTTENAQSYMACTPLFASEFRVVAYRLPWKAWRLADSGAHLISLFGRDFVDSLNVVDCASR